MITATSIIAFLTYKQLAIAPFPLTNMSKVDPKYIAWLTTPVKQSMAEKVHKKRTPKPFASKSNINKMQLIIADFPKPTRRSKRHVNNVYYNEDGMSRKTPAFPTLMTRMSRKTPTFLNPKPTAKMMMSTSARRRRVQLHLQPA